MIKKGDKLIREKWSWTGLVGVEEIEVVKVGKKTITYALGKDKIELKRSVLEEKGAQTYGAFFYNYFTKEGYKNVQEKRAIREEIRGHLDVVETSYTKIGLCQLKALERVLGSIREDLEGGK